MIRECTNPNCRLRYPIYYLEQDVVFCPYCGETTLIVEKLPTAFHSENALVENNGLNIVLILDNLRSAYNVGSIVRTCDAFGAMEIYFCGITPTLENPKVNKTALGTENIIKTRKFNNCLDSISRLKSKGYHVIGLETCSTAIPLNLFKTVDTKNIALVLGSEKTGIDPGILRICDQVVSIPMHGIKESLNVSVACGIALYYFANSVRINLK